MRALSQSLVSTATCRTGGNCQNTAVLAHRAPARDGVARGGGGSRAGTHVPILCCERPREQPCAQAHCKMQHPAHPLPQG